MSEQQPELWRGDIRIHGEAKPQGSKRPFIVKGKDGAKDRAVVVDANPDYRVWRNDVSLLMRQVRPDRPLKAAVRVQVMVYVARPKAHFVKVKGAPTDQLRPDAPPIPPAGLDLDKVQRAIGDAGTGIWWEDDDQIAEWWPRRLYAGAEGVHVRVFGRALYPEPEVLQAQREAREAAERAARTVTWDAACWLYFLEHEFRGEQIAGCRAAIREAVKTGERVVSVTFTPGQWQRMAAAGWATAGVWPGGKKAGDG